MTRFFFIVILLCFAGSGSHAQTPDADLENAVRIYNSLRDYERTLKPGIVKDSNIYRLIAFIDQARPLLNQVLGSGTAEQQKTARYFRAMCQYELGFVYGMKGENYKAYDVLKVIEQDFLFFSDSARFPLRYVYNTKNYVVKFTNCAPTIAEYYTGMGEVCNNISRNDEALKFLKLANAFPYTTNWYRYIVYSKLCTIKRSDKKRDQEYLQFNLDALRICSRLDTSYQRTIRENRYKTAVGFADTINVLLQENPAWPGRADTYYAAACSLDTAGERSKAAAFFSRAVSAGLSSKYSLQQVIDYARRSKISSLENDARVALESKRSNEPDEILRNLSTVLENVVASANDPADHFGSIRGKSTSSRLYSGKIYKSKIGLPGANEVFVNEFLDNNQANYYYWQSYLDEEPRANLQGRLKARYKAVCDEIRSIYPAASLSYTFNDENRFKLQLNPAVSIEVTLYYREGYKDVILLTVTAKYPK